MRVEAVFEKGLASTVVVGSPSSRLFGRSLVTPTRSSVVPAGGAAASWMVLLSTARVFALPIGVTVLAGVVARLVGEATLALPAGAPFFYWSRTSSMNWGTRSHTAGWHPQQRVRCWSPGVFGCTSCGSGCPGSVIWRSLQRAPWHPVFWPPFPSSGSGPGPSTPSRRWRSGLDTSSCSPCPEETAARCATRWGKPWVVSAARPVDAGS